MHNFVKKREVIAELSDFDRKCMDARQCCLLKASISAGIRQDTDLAVTGYTEA